jgi:uncharacterized membrane protein
MSCSAFAAVFGLFFVTHSVPVRPTVKARLQRHLGQTGFTVAYSFLSLIMLTALIWAAQNAPFQQLWSQTLWQRYVVFFGMFFVCLIAALAIGRPNPFSFGGARNDDYDPATPGIVRISRHPLLAAIALWAGLHLLPNGDLAHAIMFGVFLSCAVLGRWIIDRRIKRLMGPSEWHALLRKTRQSPLLQTPANRIGLAVRIGIATGVFGLLMVLHPILIRASPLPV